MSKCIYSCLFSTCYGRKHRVLKTRMYLLKWMATVEDTQERPCIAYLSTLANTLRSRYQQHSSQVCVHRHRELCRRGALYAGEADSRPLVDSFKRVSRQTLLSSTL